MLWKRLTAAITVQVVWEDEGGSDLLAPDGFLGVSEAVISAKVLGSEEPQPLFVIKVQVGLRYMKK